MEKARTEGGEALPEIGELETGAGAVDTDGREAAAAGVESPDLKWHVLWTRSHCEPKVYDQLTAKGFQPFLPRISVWSRRCGIRRPIQVPMFPGYLFLRHAMDQVSYFEALNVRGLVRILGEGWSRLETVPDREIEAILKVSESRLPALSHPYLREGRRVRITRGPLAELEGIMVRVNPNKGLLVLSVNLLQQSVAVEVDCTLVVPA